MLTRSSKTFMIDTHAHIFAPEFRDDFADVMIRAAAAGISDIIMPAITPDSLELMRSLTEVPVRLHRTIGLHPCEVSATTDFSGLEKALYQAGASSEIVAFGETGLDYYWSSDFVPAQKVSLEVHFQAAIHFGKPVILHNRNSTDDLLEMVKSAQNGKLNGVLHCFTGSIAEGRRAIDLGLKLGIGGVVTFKNGQIDQFIHQIGLENLILETDSPYLAPVPFRGKRNEPAFLERVCSRLAQCFSITPDEIADATTLTARHLFGLPGNPRQP